MDNHYGKFIHDHIWYRDACIHTDNHMYTSFSHTDSHSHLHTQIHTHLKSPMYMHTHYNTCMYNSHICMYMIRLH